MSLNANTSLADLRESTVPRKVYKLPEPGKVSWACRNNHHFQCASLTCSCTCGHGVKEKNA